MKNRLTSNLDFYRNIFLMAAAVHKQATMKYEPNGWEKVATDENDASALCSLDAMVRHTCKLCAFEENEEQSTLHHACHLAARIQMYLTINAQGDPTDRKIKQTKDQIATTKNQLIQISEMQIDVDPDEPMKYITPEFVRYCVEYNIGEVDDPYHNLSTYSKYRTFMAILLSKIMMIDQDRSADFNAELFRQVMLFLRSVIQSNPLVIKSAMTMFPDKTAV